MELSDHPSEQPVGRKPRLPLELVVFLVLLCILVTLSFFFVISGGMELLVHPFTRDQIEKAKAVTRQAKPVVNALEAYRKAMGRAPDNLEQLATRWLGHKVDPVRFSYYVKDSGEYSLSVYEGSLSFMLYYESDIGWLIAERADMSPMILGYSP